MLCLDKRLHCVAALSDAPLDDGALVAETGSGQEEFDPEFGEVVAAQVAEFDPLQAVPDAFIGIQLRGVGGQLFQPDACCTAVGQEVFDYLSAVNRRSIPDDR